MKRLNVLVVLCLIGFCAKAESQNGFLQTPIAAVPVPTRIHDKNARIPVVRIPATVSKPLLFTEWESWKQKALSESGSRVRLPENIWKLSGCLDGLQGEFKKSTKLLFNSDENGNLWTITGVGESLLFDRRNKKILFRAPGWQVLNITPNGKYLSASDPEGEGADIYRLPDMVKIQTPKNFSRLIGRGRYAVIQQRDNNEWVVDLENHCKQVAKADGTWSDGYVFESEDGKTILENGLGVISRYSLPDFKYIGDLPNMPKGFPFMNPAGTIFGCRTSTSVFLQDAATGKVRGYSLDDEDLNLLVEVKKQTHFIHAISNGKEVATSRFYEAEGAVRVMDLAKGVVIQSVDGNDEVKIRELTKNYLNQPYPHLRVNVVSGVIFPKNSKDLWILYNSTETNDSEDEERGATVLVNVGNDLEVKRALYYPNLLVEASWDEETSSIIARNLEDDDYVRLRLVPKH